MAPHSSTLAWKIPSTEEPGRLQSMGLLRIGHNWATSLSLSCIGGGNGNPPQCSCLENLRDGGAWWADIYGVAQSRTQLKQLSSSSSSNSVYNRKEPNQRNYIQWLIQEASYTREPKTPIQSRETQRLHVWARCQRGTCYLFLIWERTKQLAQDLCKTNYPPVKIQKVCLLPPRIDVSVLSLCPRKSLRYGLLHVSSVYTSALVGSQELENAGMAFISCFSCYAETKNDALKFSSTIR